MGEFWMGFLAYLLLGSLMGWAAAHYFPGFSPRNTSGKRIKSKKAIYLWSMVLGTLGATAASFGGQAIGLFTAGQMLEWGSAIAGAVLLPQMYLFIRWRLN
jgi:uncharacterized membrane protein YeaQ/YmgE (transglycosylase-associated protein family)